MSSTLLLHHRQPLIIKAIADVACVFVSHENSSDEMTAMKRLDTSESIFEPETSSLTFKTVKTFMHQSMLGPVEGGGGGGEVQGRGN